MDTTVRATCPKCQTVLRIPAQWIGQAVKCKKCGAVVRSKPLGDAAARAQANPPAVANAFDFAQPPPAENWPLPEPLAPPAAQPDHRFDPTGADAPAPAQPAPAMPGYGYPVPPGYPAPGAYGAPAGYPYAPPPGYPYPVPPGYTPPGYGYPVPPGYPAPGAYGPPPGYPYAVPPADPNAPAMPVAAYPEPAPVQVAPAASAPARRAVPDVVPPSNEFRTDVQATTGRRSRRGSGKNKWVWIVVCLLLTGGLVAGGIYGAKYLNEQHAKEKENELPHADLVRQLGSADAQARDEAYAKLKALGEKAKAALERGEKDGNADVAKRSTDLLAILNGTAPKSGPGDPGQPVARAGQFPRRMLFISISKYMYLNPLTYASVTESGIVGEDKTKPAAQRLAFEWQIPNDLKSPDGNQLFLLSDSARPDNPRGVDIPMPMKNVVMGAYEQFFATSRAQDRIVVYFGGHALEKDGKVYLAPIEGDLDDAEATLIPLAEFYDKLKACKATQKVVIWDVCRFNPQRGRQRPGSEPMTDTLYKALAAGPAGTEVVVTCQPKENALEFYNQNDPNARTLNDPKYAGSAFLESMRAVASKAARNPGKQPTPESPIPVSEWAVAVARQISQVAEDPTVNLKQTMKVEGKMLDAQTAYNATEAPAKRFEMPVPPRGTAPAEIASIVNEFTVPPISRDVIDAGISDIAFQDSVMKDYKQDVPLAEIMADKEKYKFRVATIAALDKIRKMWATAPGATGGPKLRNSFPAPVNDKLKTDIKNEQEFWAIGIAELELLNSDLDAVKPLKESEPKRWQAHYEYARAVLKARLAYMNEFNKLMGDVLTENLPALDIKRGQDSYKLVSSEKMKSKKDVIALAEEAKAAYQTLITEFKGTPWAIQAKRDKAFSLGLSWQPISTKTE